MIAPSNAAIRVIGFLRQRGWTIGLAESCSAGRLTTLLTNVPGASAVVAGGVVAYQDGVKQSLLHVSNEILEQKRTVSAACAEEMARGARQLLDVDVSVAITGSCGPTRLDPHSAIGQVFIAILWPMHGHYRTIQLCCQFEGMRQQIADQAAWKAVEELANLCQEDHHAH